MTAAQVVNKSGVKGVDISESDQKLIDDIEMILKNLEDSNQEIVESSIKQLSNLLNTSSIMMASVPKSLKYVKPYYEDLKRIHEQLGETNGKLELSKLISFLSIIMGDPKNMDTFKYFVLGGKILNESHSQEYVHHLILDITFLSQKLTETEETLDQSSLDSVKEIVSYLIRHNSEIDACDFLMEICHIEILKDSVDINNINKITEYLDRCCNLLPQEDAVLLLEFIITLNLSTKTLPNALHSAIRLNSLQKINDILSLCDSPVMLYQLLFILANVQINIDPNEIKNEKGIQVYCNTEKSKMFLDACGQLDILAPKSLADIFKRNIEFPNEGLNFVNNFVNSDVVNIRAGGLIAAGIIGTSIKDEFDSIIAIIREEIQSEHQMCRTAAILGLAIAYAGSNSAEVLDIILPHLCTETVNQKNQDFISMTCLAAGLVACGSANSDAAIYILRVMKNINFESLNEKRIHLLALSLSLIFLKQPEAAKNFSEAVYIVPECLKSPCLLLINIMAYAGTGNVEKILELVRVCIDVTDEKITEMSNTEDTNDDEKDDSDSEEKTEDKHKNFHYNSRDLAVLGMVIIALGENVGCEMMVRLISQLTRYGDYRVKSAIPMALALLNISKPSMSALQMLTKYTHDSVNAVSISAMIALGLVSAGTNNAKYSQTIKSFKATSAAQKDSVISSILNLSLGLCYMGKGALSITPLRHDGRVINLTALSSLICFSVLSLHSDEYFHGKQNYMWHILAPAISSKFFTTVDENLEPLSAPVRIGQPLDTIGQAGKPRRVTGFRTHKTPVAVAGDERVDLATEDFLPMSMFMEGTVIMKKNESTDN
ncbi:MAG: 26S proteasome non-ATPase regulatory subunit 2 [Paramarteilia canceri]